MKYDYILLDADGTLFDFDAAEANALKKSFYHFGISFQDNMLIKYHTINQMLWRKFEFDEITLKDLQRKRFEMLFDHIKVSFDTAEFHKYYAVQLADNAQLIDGAFEVCQQLCKKSKLAIVTNGISVTQNKRFYKSPLKELITAIFISEDIGYQKPQIEYFQFVFDALHINEKNKILIVGDSLSSDMQGGNNAKIDTCWYNPTSLKNETDIQIHYEISSLYDLLEIANE